jgi:hypothetical protein
LSQTRRGKQARLGDHAGKTLIDSSDQPTTPTAARQDKRLPNLNNKTQDTVFVSSEIAISSGHKSRLCKLVDQHVEMNSRVFGHIIEHNATSDEVFDNGAHLRVAGRMARCNTVSSRTDDRT